MVLTKEVNQNEKYRHNQNSTDKLALHPRLNTRNHNRSVLHFRWNIYMELH